MTQTTFLQIYKFNIVKNIYKYVCVLNTHIFTYLHIYFLF